MADPVFSRETRNATTIALSLALGIAFRVSLYSDAETIRRSFMKRIIIRGAMNQASGAETTKLPTTTAGNHRKAWDARTGVLTTTITPTPKTTAFTMQKISAATRNLALLSLFMGDRLLGFLVGQKPNEHFVSNLIIRHVGFG